MVSLGLFVVCYDLWGVGVISSCLTVNQVTRFLGGEGGPCTWRRRKDGRQGRFRGAGDLEGLTVLLGEPPWEGTGVRVKGGRGVSC